MANHEEEAVPFYLPADESQDFLPCPEGLWQCVCVDVVDLGIIKSQMYGDKRKLALIWQAIVNDENGEPMTQKDGSRFQVQKWYNATLHPKSGLAKHLAIWRGKPLAPAEVPRFDLESLIGANCQIQVIHSAPREDGKVYGNVEALVPYKGKDKAVPLDYIRVKDRPKDGDDTEAAEDEGLPF